MKAPLPIDAVLASVLAAARERPVVLVAETGAGKTTRVPPALLALGGRVLVLEPRRVAARAAARRIAEENGWTVGREAGWIVRGDRRATSDTRIVVVTDGVFLRMIQDDPELTGVAAVVVDEFHERGLGVDLATALLRQVRRDLRPDLAVLAMSATLDAAALATWLDGDVIRCPGRAFPLTVRHLARPDDLPDGVARAVQGALEHPGDVLAFLPGVREIRATAERLGGVAARVLPLFGDLPPGEQDAVLRPGGTRKIVLATNVAETSVTVPGVTTVVDSGMARILRQDAATGLDRLVLERISRAAADQRAGRAGREAPGVVWRLWSEREHAELPAWPEPEIRRVDLAGAVLELLAWGESDPAAFSWFEAPPAHAVEHALTLLDDLGARAGGGLTPLGRELATFGAHPRLARLIVEGRRRGVGAAAAVLAAVLQDPPHAREMLDVAELVRTASPAARDLARSWSSGPATGDPADLDRAVLAAWPDRVARRRDDRAAYARLVGGRGIRVLGEHPAPAWFTALVVDGGARGTSEGVARVVAPIDPAWLPTTTGEQTTFDAATDRVSTAAVTSYRDLVLASVPRPLDGAAATEALIAAARFPDVLPTTPAFIQRRARQAFAARYDATVPAPDDAWLAALLPVVARGKRSFADLRAADWALDDALPWSVRQRLDALAPEALAVPTGNRIRLDWTGDRPVLAVRIQELFGLSATPRVAGVPVVLHLLGPNGRPQQITDDLASFWDRTWPEVRKELRARYPRHSWPEDPRAAVPQSRPRRRGEGA